MYKNALLLAAIILLAVFSGCNKKELEELRSENKELNKTIEEKDKKIKQLEGQYNKVEKNLQLIVEEKDDEESEFQKISDNKLMKRLESVRETMRENRDKAESSETKLDGIRYQASKHKEKAKKCKNQLEEHKDSIKSIKETLIAKKENIEEKDSRIENQDSTISELTEKNKAFEDSLKNLTKEFNTAYSAIKPKKQIKNENVVKKKGGFLGFIGQVKVLNPTFNESNFKTLNMKEKSSITIDAKPRNIEIITPHPEKSYSLEKGEDNKTILKIKDKDNFWRAGKHLVISY
ncbi:MAG: hypothetical protein ACQESJ_02690 [Bacteroidota bacterium]